MARLIAIGDIHGGSYELVHLLKQIEVQPTDTIVTVGDYVDRGIDSKGVLDILIELSRDCHLVPILGNHDEMMLRAKADPAELSAWIGIGGMVALESYGDSDNIDLIPEEHFNFLRRCLPFYETDTHIFTHANYEESLPFGQQSAKPTIRKHVEMEIVDGASAGTAHFRQDGDRRPYASFRSAESGSFDLHRHRLRNGWPINGDRRGNEPPLARGLNVVSRFGCASIKYVTWA